MSKWFGKICRRKDKKTNREYGPYFVYPSGSTSQIYLTGKDGTLDEAEMALARLMVQKDMEASGTAGNASKSVRDVFAYYLEKFCADRSTRNIQHRVSFVEDYVKMYGDMRIQDAKASHVKEWYSSHPTWGDTYRCNACKHLSAAYNLLIADDVLDVNPVKRLRDKPVPQTRGPEHVIFPDEYRKLYAVAEPVYRDILAIQYSSGCRPEEILGATAEEWTEWAEIVKDKHKTKKKKKRRKLYLDDTAKQIIRERIAMGMAGLLYWSQNGLQIGVDVYCAAFKRWRDKTGVNPMATPYCLRGSAATRWLAEGLTPYEVAERLGNTVTIVQRHYDWYYGQPDEWKARLLR